MAANIPWCTRITNLTCVGEKVVLLKIEEQIPVKHEVEGVSSCESTVLADEITWLDSIDNKCWYRLVLSVLIKPPILPMSWSTLSSKVQRPD